MTVDELQEFVGRTVDEVQYGEGDDTAWLVFRDGSGVEVPVTPQYESEE